MLPPQSQSCSAVPEEMWLNGMCPLSSHTLSTGAGPKSPKVGIVVCVCVCGGGGGGGWGGRGEEVSWHP